MNRLLNNITKAGEIVGVRLERNVQIPKIQNDRQRQINKVMRNERKLLRTLKISHTKQILFHEHESQSQITNDKD